MRNSLFLRSAIVFCLLALLLAGAAWTAEQPKLVVLIVVDQLRYDYLPRFQKEYTGGFARLMRQGAYFTNAHLEHYPTVTAVGHATTMTGATPALHGIIGNDWYDRELKKNVTSVEDPGLLLLGAPGQASSPHRLQVSTVGDEWKIAQGGRPKVIGISLKDRAAILPAGRHADAAYWADARSGNFVSSTWYFPELPAWVKKFNDARPLDQYAGMEWKPMKPLPGTPQGFSFRRMPAEPGPKLYAELQVSPVGNEYVEAFAKAAVENEGLGQRGVTDILTVSFSSNDLVGHQFGPDSLEVRDMCLTTDLVIGRLMEFIDQKVGAGKVLYILTSDHGVAPVPEEMIKRKMPGGRFPGATLFGAIENALKAEFGEGKWLLSTAGSSPYLNHELIAEKKLDEEEVREVAAKAASQVPRVLRVFTREQLLDGEGLDDPVSRRVMRSYHAQRSGDLEIVLEPYWMRSSSGTTHGAPFSYDTHIPLIFLGPGIRPGRYHANVALNDLAPTLATMLEVETPSGSTGRVLAEILTDR